MTANPRLPPGRGRDQARRKQSEGKTNREGLQALVSTQLVWLDQLAAHPIYALTVQLQLNPRAKPFVPTVKANRPYRRRRQTVRTDGGKREEEEAGAREVRPRHVSTTRACVRWARADAGMESRKPSSREQKLGRERGPELEDTSLCAEKLQQQKEEKYLLF